MIDTKEYSEEMKFQDISIDTSISYWKGFGWLIFTLISGIFFVLAISFGEYFYKINLMIFVCALFIDVGITEVIRFQFNSLYKFRYRKVMKDKSLRSERNMNGKPNDFLLDNIYCSGCNKELLSSMFKESEDTNIEPLKFTNIGIKGHFCKDCAKFYFFIESVFSFIVVFLIFFTWFSLSTFLDYFVFDALGDFISFVIIIPLLSIFVVFFHGVKILRKYK